MNVNAVASFFKDLLSGLPVPGATIPAEFKAPPARRYSTTVGDTARRPKPVPSHEAPGYFVCPECGGTGCMDCDGYGYRNWGSPEPRQPN